MSIYNKKVSVGQFARKGEDYKDGDIVTISNEGKQIEGKFGLQDVFMVKLVNGTEKNITFNQTTINALIDAYTSDSKNWVGKEARIWLILQNVQGKMTKVTYLTHPKADIDEDGNFTIPNHSVEAEVVPEY